MSRVRSARAGTWRLAQLRQRETCHTPKRGQRSKFTNPVAFPHRGVRPKSLTVSPRQLTPNLLFQSFLLAALEADYKLRENPEV